ncbi:MAG: hypothetical protein F9K40_10875 [Kofleriaceae bacterium]|nr:MAG: hypothetical protein F9K40_10875 [Kofleriaceae bacterium]MBZ0234758.1 hypothetical protein [Kofleriaceae bacterium]
MYEEEEEDEEEVLSRSGLIDLCPGARPDSEPGRSGYRERVDGWLRAAGVPLDANRPVPTFSGEVSIFAIFVDTEGTFVYAVSNDAISADVRTALEQRYSSVFSIEGIKAAGQLFHLAFTGKADPRAMDWVASNLGLPVEPFLAARGNPVERYLGDLKALAEATVTRCYAVRLAH